MDCKEFSNLLDAFMDGALPDADARRMRAHAEECEACASLLSLRKDCQRLDENAQVPASFSSSWRQMIREEETMEEKTRKTFPWKGWVSVAAALIFVVGGTLASRDGLPSRSAYTKESGAVSGSGAAYKSSAANGVYSAYDGGSYELPMMAYSADRESAAAEEMDVSESAARQEKIIRNASFTVKTTNYDADLQQLQDLAAALGGRVQYLSSSGDASSGQTRSASLTLRIPAARLDDFLAGAQGVGTVTAMTQEMEDVSDSYYDIQTRLKTQQEKLARLQAMMASALDVSDLIEIESAIADAQYYIDRYTGQLKSYDSQVSYSTVRVTVRETRVTEIKELSLGERILTGISDSFQEFGWFLEDMVIFLAASLPWLISLAVIAIALKLIFKRVKIRKNKKEAKENKQQ